MFVIHCRKPVERRGRESECFRSERDERIGETRRVEEMASVKEARNARKARRVNKS